MTLSVSRDTFGKDPLAGLPGYSLRRAANAMMAELSGRLKVTDLRLTDATLLLLLQDGRQMTSSEIGRVLDIQRANMVPLLARLEQQGWIERRPIDRKSAAIVLTGSGQKKAAQAGDIVTRFEDELIGRIPEAHRDHLLPALDALWRQ